VGGSGGGGGGSGGGGGGDPDLDQPMNNNDLGDDAPDPPGGAGGGQPMYNPDEHPRLLCGSPPNVFDGTRDKVNSFLQAFGLYRAINCQHITMREPYNRIMMMLSYMKGPKINDWGERKQLCWRQQYQMAQQTQMMNMSGTPSLKSSRRHSWTLQEGNK
jgi:hypothetical protein